MKCIAEVEVKSKFTLQIVTGKLNMGHNNSCAEESAGKSLLESFLTAIFLFLCLRSSTFLGGDECGGDFGTVSIWYCQTLRVSSRWSVKGGLIDHYEKWPFHSFFVWEGLGSQP